tara:strand:+ start:529 stop:753 length:225 start_codon:yes stop_codon:yes gene_type:complete
MKQRIVDDDVFFIKALNASVTDLLIGQHEARFARFLGLFQLMLGVGRIRGRLVRRGQIAIHRSGIATEHEHGNA